MRDSLSFSPSSLCALLEAHTPRAATGFLVGISGGADSACLLTALGLAQRAALLRLPVRAIHVDHGLQPAAALFRRASEELCRHLGVELTCLTVTGAAGRGESIEAAARAARYRGIAGELAAGECLLTAHHAEDQAETLLLQLLRGAGLKGMSAMPPCRAWHGGWHLRPLLTVSRSDLHRFGLHSGVAAVRDPMNEDLRFDRAYLRSAVWPAIVRRWPAAAATLSRAALHVADGQQLLDETAAASLPVLRDGAALRVPGLRALSAAEQRNVLRHWIAASGVEPPSTARLVEALRQIKAARDDQLPTVVWGNHALRRYRGRMFLTSSCPPAVGAAPRTWSTNPDAVLELGPELGSLHWTAQRGGLDARRLPVELCVRQRRGGEALRPQRRARTQSVQHLCQAWGVLPWLRDALPLIFAGDELIAVGDLWLEAGWCVAAGESGLGCEWRDAPPLV